ncbi:unnamed protein product [Polarella glacialis]|uniref:Gfo/Idh/MocA-like oxidoreductase N-terminal domain-containing protein n=1 Tax=Polarella glacialis TaxID=89957 RepID=A0A813HXX1_POLGL|nr:unnamed protein product [Polarella glacialis]
MAAASEEEDLHPLLVSAVKAEYLRTFVLSNLQARAAAAGSSSSLGAVLKAAVGGDADVSAFLAGSLSHRGLLARMFGDRLLVDRALSIIWGQSRWDNSDSRWVGCVDALGTADEEPIAVALVGCGAFGSVHARRILACPGLRITWLVDPSRSSAETLAAQPFWEQPPAITTELPEALADSRVGAVIVVSPPSTHYAVAAAALAAGKAVLCEKPLTLDLKEGQALSELTEAPGAPTFVLGYPRRFGIDDHKIRSSILSTLGRPLFYRDVWGVVKGHASEEIHRLNGGGGLLYENSHTLDSYNWTLGTPTEVFAVAEKFKADPTGTHAQDTYLLVIYYEGGDKVVFSSSWAAPGIGARPWQSYGRRIRPVMDIVGPQGFLHYPVEDPEFQDSYLIFAGTAEDYVEKERFPVRNDHESGVYREQFHFQECIRGRQTPLCTARDGVMVLAVIAAAHKSALSGLPEPVVLEQPREGAKKRPREEQVVPEQPREEAKKTSLQ